MWNNSAICTQWEICMLFKMACNEWCIHFIPLCQNLLFIWLPNWCNFHFKVNASFSLLPLRCIHYLPLCENLLYITLKLMYTLFEGECKSRFTSRKVPYCIKYHPEEDKQHLFVAGTSDKKIVCVSEFTLVQFLMFF